MQQIGLNNNLEVGNHQFHVQTAYSPGKLQIISHVFDHGQIIEQRQVTLPGHLAAPAISKQVQAVHQETIAEMETLFLIAQKVKQVKHAPSCFKLGAVFLEKNLLEDAIESLQLALQIAPDTAEAHTHLAVVHFRQNNLSAAAEAMRQSLKLAPDFADSHYLLGIINLEMGELDKAAQAFEAALDINGDFIQARVCLMLSHLLGMRDGDEIALPLESILDSLEEISQSDSPDKKSSHLANALARTRQRGYAAAAAELQALRQGFQIWRGCTAENEFYLKFLYGNKSQDDAFTKEYVKKLRADLRDHPEYADLHNNLGVAYLIQCRNLFLKALEEFRAALKINPKFKHAEKNLKLSENERKGFLILLRAILK